MEEDASRDGGCDDDDSDVEIEPNDTLITGSVDTSIKIWSLYSGECLNVSSSVGRQGKKTEKEKFLDPGVFSQKNFLCRLPQNESRTFA